MLSVFVENLHGMEDLIGVYGGYRNLKSFQVGRLFMMLPSVLPSVMRIVKKKEVSRSAFTGCAPKIAGHALLPVSVMSVLVLPHG